MKVYKSRENSRTKSGTNRKFYSVPSLPIGEARIKGTNMLVVSPDDIRKYRNQMGLNNGEGRIKNPKQNQRVLNKNLKSKEPTELLKESLKFNGKNKKKNPTDLQYQIKKKIIKVMGGSKNMVKKEITGSKRTDYETKTITKNTSDLKKKSDTIKENRQGLGNVKTLLTNAPPIKGIKSDINPKLRANTAILPQKYEIMSKLRAQTASVVQPKVNETHKTNTNTSQPLKKKTVTKGKVDPYLAAFKSMPEAIPVQVRGNKLNVISNEITGTKVGGISLYEELKAAEAKGKQDEKEKKRVTKKSSKLAEKPKKPIVDDSSVIKGEKKKRIKKAPVDKDIDDIVNGLPKLALPSIPNKVETKVMKEKKIKHPPKKAQQTITV